MEDTLLLLVLCSVMFLGAFLAGMIPLAFTLNEERLRLVSSFGAGILVGTALIIILPEGVQTLYSREEGAGGETGHEGHGDDFDGARYMGVALAFGFVAMFIVDQLGPASSHSHGVIVGSGGGGGLGPSSAALGGAHHHHHISVGNLAQEFEAPARISSAFIGLLIHNAADGVAMGAAASGHNSSLEIVVFFAILLHKAPAAFGLTTFLLSEGHTRKGVRFLLAIFCSVPPIATLLTYILLMMIKLPIPQNIWTGLVLLFSAGSFLYVATIHVMPELLHREALSNLDTPSTAPPPRLSKVHFMAMIAGMFTPLLLQIEHSHGGGGHVHDATAGSGATAYGNVH